MKQVTDLAEYQELVERYRQHGVRTNDYIQQEASSLIQQGKLFALCQEHNAFLFVRKDAGMRLYYYLNDLHENAHLISFKDLVIEILFRSNIPDEEVNYFVREGFSVNLVRDQYCGTYKDLSIVNVAVGVKFEIARTLEMVAEVCELFNASFDRLSGDFIPIAHYAKLLSRGAIIVALDANTNQMLGALHQTQVRGVNWISHVAVKTEARGKRIGSGLVSRFLENNRVDDKTRYMLWVQRQNEVAVKMYRQMGFKYMNKSTLSLIK